MSSNLSAAPVLSTPDDHILEVPTAASQTTSTLAEDALRTIYEIPRTASEIRQGGWKRIALQFPDHMLVDAPRVVEALKQELSQGEGKEDEGDEDNTNTNSSSTSAGRTQDRRVCILADTSYSACCVDEIAAEHTDADVVVHYGRTCLSPTSRLPVIHVYTSQELDHASVLREFTKEFPDKDAKVVVMADLTYQSHVWPITSALREAGYGDVVATEVQRDPGGIIPNRRIEGGREEVDDEESLRSYSMFHISDPPAALLLALQSRFVSLHILSVPSPSTPAIDNPTMRTAGLLRRRFAKVLSLASAGVIGILVNTLSVSNYLSSIDALRAKIAKAGKKSYTVVVGKLNPAKLANFAEIEGWVVVGCWESGLVEDDAAYWRPVITPFELEIALMDEEQRVWGGEWWAGIEKLKLADDKAEAVGTDGSNDNEAAAAAAVAAKADGGDDDQDANLEEEDGVEGEESLPPMFDLRTGKLMSHSRPMQLTVRSANESSQKSDQSNGGGGAGGQSSSAALVKRVAGELTSINGVASPGAEYLRSQRTWQGLGSDFDREASTLIEEGRSGIARGYQVGEAEGKH